MGSDTSDPAAPFYNRFEHESGRETKMYETIGRIIVAWGAAENALAKLWWHLAFQDGMELDRDNLIPWSQPPIPEQPSQV